MNYELALKLKEAGWPQHPFNAWCGCGAETINDPHFPTLSELIEACGEQFLSLEKNPDGWLASSEEDGNMPVGIDGATPEEAVANLWLALNKK